MTSESDLDLLNIDEIRTIDQVVEWLDRAAKVCLAASDHTDNRDTAKTLWAQHKAFNLAASFVDLVALYPIRRQAWLDAEDRHYHERIVQQIKKILPPKEGI